MLVRTENSIFDTSCITHVYEEKDELHIELINNTLVITRLFDLDGFQDFLKEHNYTVKDVRGFDNEPVYLSENN